MMIRKSDRQTKYIRLIMLALWLVLCLCSCVTMGTRPTGRGEKVRWEGKTPTWILEQVVESREKIVSLTAVFSLSLDPPPQGRLSHIQGVLIFEKRPDGPYVRIKGMGFFGRLLFDMVHHDDEVRVYVPSRETLYCGRMAENTAEGDMGSDLFRTMFSDFSHLRVPSNGALAFDQDKVIVPLTNGKMIMGRATGLLNELHMDDRIVTYDQYQQENGFPPFPGRITVRQEDGVQRASCRLSQVRVNIDITDIFDLSVYHPKFIRDLAQLNMLGTP